MMTRSMMAPLIIIIIIIITVIVSATSEQIVQTVAVHKENAIEHISQVGIMSPDGLDSGKSYPAIKLLWSSRRMSPHNGRNKYDTQ